MQKDTVSSSAQGSLIGGILLLSGTCIGAGMLALPVITGLAGFLPAMAINILCWLFMMSTGLLFLETTLWMPDDSNLLSMAYRFLGQWGKWIGGIAFLFLYYCLLVSYLDGGTPLFHLLVERLTSISLSTNQAYILFGGLSALIVLMGTGVVDRVNWILMMGLILSYFLLLGAAVPTIQVDLLKRSNWSAWLLAAPALFSAYGYHNVIPTVTSYLRRDPKKMRLVIIIGTTIPFIVYSLWQLLIIGSLPLELIQHTDQEGVPITHALQEISGHPWISSLGAYFGFFALITSLLGVSLSMVDFLGDGLSIHRRGWNRIWLCALVFLPPALFAAYNPGIFITAISIAGGIGESILNGLFPIFMVWQGRYAMGLTSDWELPGGRWTLIILIAFTLLIMGVEIQQLFHLHF